MEFVNLSNICDVYSGYAFKNFNDKKEGKPVIKIRNIKIDGTINKFDCSYTNEVPLEKFYSQKEDLYIALSGATTGKVGIMDEEGYLINQRVGVIRKKDINVPINYIKVFLDSITGKILKDAVGAAQPNISPKDILKYKFPLRRYDEMVKISNIFTNINNKINICKKYILNLDDIVKSQFIEMFGTIDLSEKRKEWEEICNVTKIYTGTTPSTSDESNWDGEILWITPAEMNFDTFFVYDTVRKITEKGRKSKSLDLMPTNTVLLSTRAPIGKVGIVGTPMTSNQGFKNFECLDRLNPIYLYTLLKNNTEYLNFLGSGTTFLEVSKSTISKMRIPMPKIELQNKFAAFVQQIDKSKFIVQKQIKLLEELLEKKMNEYFGQ